MPGRGRFWSLGSLNDGIVEEDDLTQALQTKVNSGGGGHVIQDEGTPLVARGNLNFIGAGVVASDGVEDTTNVTISGGGGGAWQQIGKFVVVTPATSVSISFTPEILDGTNMSIKLVGNLKLNITDTINTRIDNRADGDYILEGGHSAGATHTGVLTNPVDGWTTGKNVTSGETTFIEVELAGNRTIGASSDEVTCLYKERSASGVFYGGGTFATVSATSISSFDVKSTNGIATISAGSTFVAYKQVIT